MHGPVEPVLAEARALLGEAAPAAIVALAERTVLTAARLRASYGLPGNDPTAALRCADKVEMKRAMDAAGIPVAPWRALENATRAPDLVEALGLPILLKPRRDSGGRGQRKVDDEAALDDALARLRQGDSLESGYGWLAEGWVDGVEMSIEAFVQRGEVRFLNPTEYLVPGHASIVPAALDEASAQELRAFAARALAAVGVERGMRHLELFRTDAGPVFGEVAVRPPGGRLMPLLARAWRFDPWKALLRLELGEDHAFPEAPVRTAGAWVLHPGAGRVAAIHGLAEARAVPHVRRLSLKAAVGQQIAQRLGTGQDIGSVRAEGPDRDTVAAALERAHACLRIELH